MAESSGEFEPQEQRSREPCQRGSTSCTSHHDESHPQNSHPDLGPFLWVFHRPCACVERAIAPRCSGTNPRLPLSPRTSRFRSPLSLSRRPGELHSRIRDPLHRRNGSHHETPPDPIVYADLIKPMTSTATRYTAAATLFLLAVACQFRMIWIFNRIRTEVNGTLPEPDRYSPFGPSWNRGRILKLHKTSFSASPLRRQLWVSGVANGILFLAAPACVVTFQ